jgi:hypothetical protein
MQLTPTSGKTNNIMTTANATKPSSLLLTRTSLEGFGAHALAAAPAPAAFPPDALLNDLATAPLPAGGLARLVCETISQDSDDESSRRRSMKHPWSMEEDKLCARPCFALGCSRSSDAGMRPGQ